MSEHTSTPWMLRHNPDTGDIHILAPSAFHEGRTVMVTSVGTVLEEAREANAEFIVRACNAHDELVAALEKIADVSRQALEKKSHEEWLVGIALLQALADEAIEKARGER